MAKSRDEYLMLRDEILHLDTLINNTINFFYVFIATFLAFAVNQDDTIFILMSYIVTIPAYLIVISKTKGMCKIGAYLKVFHEGKDYNWESRRIMYQKSIKNNLFKYMASTTFPFVFVGIAVNVLFFYYTPWSCTMPFYEISKIFLCFALFIILLILIWKNKSINTEDFVEKWKEIKEK